MIGSKWIEASHCFARWVKPAQIVVDIQGLAVVAGILDKLEEQYTPIYQRQQAGDADVNTDANLFLLNEITVLSRMWILSGYEILRVIRNEMTSNEDAPSLPEEFQKLFWNFSMVRMETAKYEIAKIRSPLANSTNIFRLDERDIIRVGWRVFCKKTEKQVALFRGGLASEFVDTFSRVKANFPQTENN